MIKVLIADDEPLVRAGIKTVLPWNMYGFDVIAEADRHGCKRVAVTVIL